MEIDIRPHGIELPFSEYPYEYLSLVECFGQSTQHMFSYRLSATLKQERKARETMSTHERRIEPESDHSHSPAEEQEFQHNEQFSVKVINIEVIFLPHI